MIGEGCKADSRDRTLYGEYRIAWPRCAVPLRHQKNDMASTAVRNMIEIFDPNSDHIVTSDVRTIVKTSRHRRSIKQNIQR